MFVNSLHMFSDIGHDDSPRGSDSGDDNAQSDSDSEIEGFDLSDERERDETMRDDKFATNYLRVCLESEWDDLRGCFVVLTVLFVLVAVLQYPESKPDASKRHLAGLVSDCRGSFCFCLTYRYRPA